MKPAAFEFVRASTLSEATTILLESDGAARVVAGAQSIGPMLNLRLVQPRVLVDVTGIAELTAIEDRDDAVTLGACITTANIEDGRLPGRGLQALSLVASRIAYRAVRNRATIGGSVCHADPAADWVPALCALEAECVISGPQRCAPACDRRVRHRCVRERPRTGGTAAGDPYSAALVPWSLGLQQALPQGRRVRACHRGGAGRSRARPLPRGHWGDPRSAHHCDRRAQGQAVRRRRSG